MTPDPREYIDGYFDQVLTPEQHAELNAWLKSDLEHAKIFAKAALLHDRMRNTLSVEATPSQVAGVTKPKVLVRLLGNSFSAATAWRTTAGVSVLVAGLTLLWFSFGPATASAAIRELDRLILNSVRLKDRTYEIVVENIVTSTRQGDRLPQRESQRPPKPPLDGATLHVREGNRFVLIRKTVEGLPFITGSDGRQSWAVNTRGPVRVSSDIHHFDHDLPGHETSVPLVNLHEGLKQLRQAYHLQFAAVGPEEYEVADGDDVRVLLAVKKPKERGPQRVEIAYEAKTGRILHMRFIHMPYGPDRVDIRLSLVNENELPVDFFEHASHHSSDRNVETEN